MDTLEPKLSARPRNIDPEEWAVRVDLAACYRLIAHFGMDDLILGHISARVPGAEALEYSAWRCTPASRTGRSAAASAHPRWRWS